MNQIWTIFRKDTRHHWPEIATSLAALTAFGWVEILSWRHFGALAFDFASVFAHYLPGLVTALVPLSWIFLIVRVVQDESLVGDRQFWVSRPYDWKLLLAAKTLFVLVFINLPLFWMDAFLLSRAGFHPAHYLGGLLWMQLMWIFTLFVFVFALASITKNIPQILLAMLLVALYLIGLIALSQVIPDSDYSATDWWAGILLGSTAVAIVLLQYARRRTGISRWLAAAVLLIFGLALVVIPYRSLITRAYPLSHGDVPNEVTLLPPNNSEGTYLDEGGEVSIRLPVSVSQLPKETFVELNGMIVTLTNANGFRWDSGWKSQYLSFFPNQKAGEISFEIKRQVFDKLKSSAVSIHLLLAFSAYRDTNQREFVVPHGEFQMPDVGICFTSNRAYWYNIRCQAPLRPPAFLLITSEMAASTCLRKQDTPPPPGLFSHGSVRDSDSDPAQMGISPLHEVNIYLPGWDAPGTHIQSPGICPGTPLILSNPELMGRSRVELQFDELSLTDYQQGAGKIIIR